MKDRGIRNVLALRGDLPEGYEAGDFRYAKDLIPVLADAGILRGRRRVSRGPYRLRLPFA